MCAVTVICGCCGVRRLRLRNVILHRSSNNQRNLGLGCVGDLYSDIDWRNLSIINNAENIYATSTLILATGEVCATMSKRTGGHSMA